MDRLDRQMFPDKGNSLQKLPDTVLDEIKWQRASRKSKMIRPRTSSEDGLSLTSSMRLDKSLTVDEII